MNDTYEPGQTQTDLNRSEQTQTGLDESIQTQQDPYRSDQIHTDLDKPDQTYTDPNKPDQTRTDLTRSDQIYKKPVQIPEHQAISVDAALSLAPGEGVEIGKSTLQEKARHWYEEGENAEVLCVKIVSPKGRPYRLHREQFISWLKERRDNTVSTNPEPTTQTQTGLNKSDQIRQDVDRSEENEKPVGESSNDNRYVDQLEQERDRLVDQLKIKDEQIQRSMNQVDMISKLHDSLIQRNQELHVLLQTMQKNILNVPKTEQTDQEIIETTTTNQPETRPEEADLEEESDVLTKDTNVA